MRKQTYGRLMLTMLFSLALALALGACYPNEPEDASDLGLVITIDNPDGNYSNMLYWAMPDTVMPLINEDDNSSEPIGHEHDRRILETIEEQMAARGFIRVFEPGFADGDTMPDVVVQAGAVQSDAWIGFIYYGYGYWGYPGYGWGYPTTGYYKYTQGTVLWGMTDYRGVTEDNFDDPGLITPVLWAAAINGVMSGEGSTNPEVDIPRGITQGFTQSTYIQATSR